MNEYYWESHYSLMDKHRYDIRPIKDILDKFQRKLMKVEKMLMLIQEREYYLENNDRNERITEKDTNKLNHSWK